MLSGAGIVRIGMVSHSMNFAKHYGAVMKSLMSHGLLLGSYDAAGKANVMTIGWGAIGSIWGEPVWIVLVRPSRYTYRCIEHSGCFTVNVPTEAMGMACVSAGSKSGAKVDKFQAANLTSEPSASVLAPRVVECPLVYECHVIHSNDVLPGKLPAELSGLYVDDVPHRVYYGKIVAVHETPDAAKLLAE